MVKKRAAIGNKTVGNAKNDGDVATAAKERNAADDFEALKVILDGYPPLKARVLQKLRQMKEEIRKKSPRASKKL